MGSIFLLKHLRTLLQYLKEHDFNITLDIQGLYKVCYGNGNPRQTVR